jgi:poly-gamma-glutamate synthesis protein (capsule biosynthesis protein)
MPHADGRGQMTLALAGDAIITRKLSVYEEPEFLRLRELIQEATAAVVNLEVLLHRFEDDVIPAAASGGTYMQADPEMAKELAWMGFDMVSRANNHTMDYGVGGLRHTDRAVEEAGLVDAGTGENLALARSPGYLETPGGRVALISAASTFADPMRAGAQRKDLRGRPGLNPIRYERIYQVTPEQMESLRDFRESMGWGRGSGDRLRLFGETFQEGDEFKSLTAPNEEDLAAIVATVDAAKRQADYVVFASHSHERGGSNTEPADFLRTLAHAVIDAGADVFVGHGPHVLRGIEIYRGKPVFYSLGDFLFQNETVPFQPADNFHRYGLGPDALAPDFFDTRQSGGGFPANPMVWESVLARVHFRAGEATEIELHPITLGHGLPRPQRGRSLLASGELAEKILRDVKRLSEPMGTTVEIRDGTGVIRVR